VAQETDVTVALTPGARLTGITVPHVPPGNSCAAAGPDCPSAASPIAAAATTGSSPVPILEELCEEDLARVHRRHDHVALHHPLLVVVNDLDISGSCVCP
jgi:hypothetical protein